MVALAIFIGGGLGALSRFGLATVARRLVPGASLPWGTLAANLLGCFALGVLAQLFAARGDLSPAVRMGLTTGFLGGLTTFSTFSHETASLMQAQPLMGAANLLMNVVPGLLLAFAGMWVGGRLA